MNYLLQICRYSLPLRTLVRTAHGDLATREGIILRLEDEAGRAGLGEVAPVPGFGGATVDEIEAMLRAIGSPERDSAQFVSADEFSALMAQNAGICFALESAFTEIAVPGWLTNPNQWPVNRLAALSPYYRHLQNARQAGENLALPVAALLPAGREAKAKIGALGEAGFRTFKWKVGVAAVEEELPLLDDLCAELPPGARLRLDANGAWDRRAAERWLERCAERPVEFVEQPCPATTMESTAQRDRAEDLLRGLAEDFPTPLALDESLTDAGAVARWLATGWRGVWVIKPGLLGGAETLAQLHRADADVVFSSALETAVGTRAALRVALGWGKKQRALGFGVGPLFQDLAFNGLYPAPFIWADAVERINGEATWNALN